MVHLLVQNQLATLTDGSVSYKGRTKSPDYSADDLRSIRRWMLGHPLVFAQNDGKPVGKTLLQQDMFVVPHVADNAINFCVCPEGNLSEAQAAIGLCETPAQVIARFEEFTSAATRPDRAAVRLGLLRSARQPAPAPLDEAPPAELINRMVHLANGEDRPYIMAHSERGWQIGKRVGDETGSWVLACNNRLILPEVTGSEAGCLLRALPKNAPATAQEQDAVVEDVFRERDMAPLIGADMEVIPLNRNLQHAQQLRALPLLSPDRGADGRVR